MPSEKENPLRIDTGYGPENAPIDYAFKIAEQALAPKARSNKRLTVCAATELPAGGKRIVEDGTLSIGVFNIEGQFYALKNVCPHQGAPLCSGSIHSTHAPSSVHEFKPCLHNRVVRCPWHGWEFDIISGKGLYDATSRVATYKCEVDSNGDIIVLL